MNLERREAVIERGQWPQLNAAEGCLVTMVKNATGTPLYGFEYGGTGERQMQNTYTSGQISSTRAFLYDREDVIAEFSNDTFATIFRRYIHGPGIDEPLAILGDDVGEYTQYLHDGLGSVTGVVDENGNLGAIDYSAFGETRSNTVKIENRYRYTSREFVETNLYYYRARHMHPDLGRFISMDPLKTIDGTNMMLYVGNNLIDFSDPLGMQSYYASTYCKDGILTYTILDHAPRDLRNCLAKHEEDHLSFIHARHPYPCCGDGEVFQSLFQGEEGAELYRIMECQVHALELSCLLSQRPTTTFVKDRINKLLAYLENYRCDSE